MRINRLLVIGLMATSLLASCKKDINSDDQGNGITFTARTEQNRDGSRTYIEPEGLDQDDSADVLWAEDDHILVSNGSKTLDFGLTDGDHTTEGTFYTGGDHDDFFVHDYLALYPSANAEDVPNTLNFQTGIATFHLPSTQVLDRENSFANKTMPMVCHDTDEDLNFKNVFGGLIIPLMIDEELGIESIRVDRVVLTSLKADDKLWGTFTADCRSDNPRPTHTSGDGGNTLTLTCDLTLGTEEYTNFIFIVPPGSLSEGFKVEAYYGASMVYEQLFDWATAEHGFEIPRSVLMKVQTTPIDVHVEPDYLYVSTISPTYIGTTSALAMGFWEAFDDLPEPSYLGFVYALADNCNGDPESNLVIGGSGVNNTVVTETDYPDLEFYDRHRFEASMTGLLEDMIYYVRSYCIDVTGTVCYGDPYPFATRYDYSGKNHGMSRSKFSISDDKQVRFSMGNLQYQASTDTWRFAEYQFEFVGDGEYVTNNNFNGRTHGNVFANGQHPHAIGDGTQSDNEEIGSAYAQWIDLFGYGTSGYDHGANCYQPWSTSTNESDYHVYGNDSYNLYDGDGTADWGYNVISNSYDEERQWRTLNGEGGLGSYGSSGEWGYLLYERDGEVLIQNNATLTVRGDIRKTNGDEYAYEIRESDVYLYHDYYYYCGTQVNGLIIFPDEFDWYGIREFGVFEDYLESDYSEAKWSLLEKFGAVFLPDAGRRWSNYVDDIGNRFYWSSTKGVYVYDWSDYWEPSYSEAYSVRLVHDVDERIRK